MPSHHLIISGTGRAGTTFLVQLLTELGLDTGFRAPGDGLFEHCDAGMEWDFHAEHLPYVLKSPFLCLVLDRLLEERDIVIDHAIVPMRELSAAAESRRDVTRRTPPSAAPAGEDVPAWAADLVPGGLIPTRRGETQEAALSRMFHDLVLTLTRRRIPTTFLEFPRLVRDDRYLYEQIAPALPGIDAERFAAAFAAVARPALVHDFSR